MSSSLWLRVTKSTCFHSRAVEVEWTFCGRKQTGSRKRSGDRVSENSALQSLPGKGTLNQVWQLTAPWQLGLVKGKEAQVLLGLWLHRCSGAAAHCSIKGDYRDRAICHRCQNKREPFYVSVYVCVPVCVCERKTENPSCLCTLT